MKKNNTNIDSTTKENITLIKAIEEGDKKEYVSYDELMKFIEKKIAGGINSLDGNQIKDFALGMLMDKVKTNELVSKEDILKKLKK